MTETAPNPVPNAAFWNDGKIGFGKRNFTADFSNTEEFKRLTDLGYVNIRYPENNPFGVRYEPWHIKVV